MPIEKVRRSFADVLKNSGEVIKLGVKTIKKNPQILAYPYLAAVVVLLTFSTVNTFAFWIWNHFTPDTIFLTIDNTPDTLRIALGLVTFSVFYTAFITAFFTCAVSADVLSDLNGKSVSALHGFGAVSRKFFRVTHFALFAIFFFPIGLFVQRHKLRTKKGAFDVLGSSLSLSMSQLAPAILTTDKGISGTIRDSIDILGKFWRESLLIKTGMYSTLFLVGLLGFLPKLIEKNWFDGDTAHTIGWLVSILLWLVGYIIVRVIGNVFTSALYYKAKTE